VKHLDISILTLSGLIIILAGYFYLTGGLDLVSAGEARAAQIAREMVERQNFILPSLNHEVSRETMTKPPLFHWSLILTAAAAGWSNNVMHLPSALAAIGTVLLVYVLGAAMFGRRAGLYSALVLSSTLMFLTNANAARIDILFAFLMLAAITAFYCAQKDPGQRRIMLLFYLCAALAVMSKGPAGILLPLVIAVVFLWRRGQLSMLRELYPGRGVLLFLLVATPWYIGVAVTAPPELVQHFFFGQLSHWWAGSGAAGKAGKAAWYYLPYLFIGMFPWSIFLPLALVYAVSDALRQRQHAVALLLIWFLGGLVVFSLGGKKAARYLLPMLPAGAILLGYYWDRLSGAINLTQRNVQVVFAVLMIVALAGLWLWLAWGFRNPAAMEQLLLQGRNEGDTVKLQLGWHYLLDHASQVLVLLGLMMLAAVVALTGFARQHLVAGTLATALVAWLGLFSYSAWFEPVKVDMMSPAPVAREVARLIPGNASIYVGGNAYKHAFSWYLHRDLQRASLSELQERLLGPGQGPAGDWLVFMTKEPVSGPHRGEYRLVKQWQVEYYTISLFGPQSPG